MLTDNDIVRISRRIVDGYGPLAVGTFGSYAVGAARERSDLDLFVIKDTPLPRNARARAVHRLLHGVLHPLDIHVFTPAEFEETVYENLSFAWVILRQARVYYWSDEATKVLPSFRGLRGPDDQP
jgi:predicted nucleotidyltransferase